MFIIKTFATPQGSHGGDGIVFLYLSAVVLKYHQRVVVARCTNRLCLALHVIANATWLQGAFTSCPESPPGPASIAVFVRPPPTRCRPVQAVVVYTARP